MQNPAHIILADDDRDDQFLFREAIEKSYGDRFLVDPVYNGVELLDRLHDPVLNSPEFIVLDLNMPLKDGISALKEIRKEKLHALVPVFVLSTSSSEDDMNVCRELGCTQYYRKPYHLSQYSSIISDMIRRSHMVTH